MQGNPLPFMSNRHGLRTPLSQSFNSSANKLYEDEPIYDSNMSKFIGHIDRKLVNDDLRHPKIKPKEKTYEIMIRDTELPNNELLIDESHRYATKRNSPTD